MRRAAQRWECLCEWEHWEMEVELCRVCLGYDYSALALPVRCLFIMYFILVPSGFVGVHNTYSECRRS
jgi:hypothetical protein